MTIDHVWVDPHYLEHQSLRPSSCFITRLPRKSHPRPTTRPHIQDQHTLYPTAGQQELPHLIPSRCLSDRVVEVYSPGLAVHGRPPRRRDESFIAGSRVHPVLKELS